MHFVVTCNNQASFVAAKYVTYTEGYTTAAAVAMEVGGSNIITCA